MKKSYNFRSVYMHWSCTILQWSHSGVPVILTGTNGRLIQESSHKGHKVLTSITNDVGNFFLHFCQFFSIYVFKFCCYQDIVNWDFVVKKFVGWIKKNWQCCIYRLLQVTFCFLKTIAIFFKPRKLLDPCSSESIVTFLWSCNVIHSLFSLFLRKDKFLVV